MRKYDTNIDDTMIQILKEKKKIQYNQLYRELCKKLGRKISYETFGIRINRMLAEKTIKRKEDIKSNQKIKPVFYSII
jgi:hypothetical protein